MPTQKQLLAHADAHPAHSTPTTPLAESDVTNLVTDITAKFDKSSVDADATMTGNSDAHVASQKATKTALALKLNASAIDTDSAMAADSDAKVPSQKAAKAALDAKIASSAIDTDSTMTANSDTKLASQKATKTALATKVTGAVADFTKAPVAAPSAANSTGVAGTWAYDATHLYVCVDADTWVRCTLATWP